MTGIRARLRPVDYLPLLFVGTVGMLSFGIRRPLIVDTEALGAWAIFTLLWGLIVAVPLYVRFDRRFLAPKYENLPGHTLIIVLTVLLVFSGAIQGLFQPIGLMVLGLIAFLIYTLGRSKAHFSPREFLFRWSPVIISFFMYENLRWFVSNLNDRIMDAELAAWDLKLFGQHVSLWMEPYQTPWLTEWMSFHYGAYILYPLITGTLFYYHDKHEAFEDFALGFGLCMYVGFLGYVCVPAVGPISGLLDLYTTPTVPGMSLSDFRHTVVEKYRYVRDAFPSLHTANSLLCVIMMRPHYPRLFRIALFFEANLLLSTLYLRMHYTVDLLAGAALALFAVWAAPRINRASNVPPAQHTALDGASAVDKTVASTGER